MSFAITVSGHGPVDDDLRDAFTELVRSLRAATPDAAGNTLGGTLVTGEATYTVADIPDAAPSNEDDDAADADADPDPDQEA